MSKKYLMVIAASFLLATSCITVAIKATPTLVTAKKKPPKNIIFMIVDGMGFSYIEAARIYNGGKPFSFEDFPCQTRVTTCSAAGATREGHCLADTTDVTDSAAAATAMATGYKVNNGAISRGDHQDLKTILESLKDQGKSTGIVATKLFTDATPAAFVSHAKGRDFTDKILNDIFLSSKPNVILAADNPKHRKAAESKGSNYHRVHSALDLKNLAADLSRRPCSSANCPYVYGGFGQHEMIPGLYGRKSGFPLEIAGMNFFKEHNLPHLAEMTDAALRILSQNTKGFFLMVESSLPDMIGHFHADIDKKSSSILAVIHEILEVERTVKVIKSFIDQNPDTLLVLTADHETGGLMIDEKNTPCLGEQKCLPSAKWTAKTSMMKLGAATHTNVMVPLFAVGRGAKRFCVDKINNTDLSHLALGNSL